MQRTGAEIGAPVGHIYSSDGVFTCLLLNCHSRQACISYQTGEHSQSSQIPLPFARAGRTMTAVRTVRLGSPESKPSLRVPQPVPGEQGSPQSSTRPRQSSSQGSKGPTRSGCWTQQPATSRGSTVHNSSGVGTRDTDVPRSTSLGRWKRKTHSPRSASHKHTARHEGGTVFNFIPHSPSLDDGLGSTSSPPSCKASEAHSLMRDNLF